MRSVVDCCGFSIAKDRPDGHNEDFFECRPRSCEGSPAWADFVAVVADGVGSTTGAEDAAAVAAKTWLLYAESKFAENGPKCAGFDSLHFNEITSYAFVQAHEAVQRSTTGGACAVAACLQGDRLVMGNVGDCRAYRISGPRVELLSEDQIDSGGDPTDVVGGKRLPHPHAAADTRVRAGDIIILCTDGIWKLLDATEIRQAASGSTAKEIAAKLQQAVASRRKAGSDDATAVVALIKRVGEPFWEMDSSLEEDELREDLMESKLNDVLAELLNRVRAPIEKQNARAEQTLAQMSAAVDELRAEINALHSDSRRAAGGGQSGVNLQSSFLAAALSLILLVGGIGIGWGIRGTRQGNPAQVKLQLPADSSIVSQQYSNDRLLVKFLDSKKNHKLAIFRLEDGGKPFAIIDQPGETRP